MKEEFITKSFLRFLIRHGWEILSYDFPHSGTGVSLHPNAGLREVGTKNAGVITPDTISFKIGVGIISQSKPYFDKGDVEKLQRIKRGDYSESLNRVFRNRQIDKLCIGIVLPSIEIEISKARGYHSKINFLIGVRQDGSCEVKHLSGLSGF